MRLGELPLWLKGLATRMHHDGIFPDVPDQVSINEYLPGQGIADHIDCTPCFGEVVVSLSLAGTAVMDFKHASQTVSILLEPRSVLVIRDEARYQWTHGIPRRKHDLMDGGIITRARRLSATFRKVIIAS
jgi:alkylated DNA repair dioxygenase AlkB